MIGMAIVGVANGFPPHARSFVDLKDRVRVVWAVARTDARLQPVATEFGFPVTTDLAAALADPAVDAVLVLTPANTHLEMVEAALAAGKHVLCEKPLEVTIPRAEALVSAGRRAGKRLGVVFQQRFRVGNMRLKQLLTENALGEIQAAWLTVPWWRPQTYYDEPGRGVLARDGGGVLITQAIHQIDLFRWLVGISSVQASQLATTKVHKMETEDYASALIRLGNGAPGTIVATTAAYPGSAGEIKIIGTEGSATLEGGSLSVAWQDGRRENFADAGGSGSGVLHMAFAHDAHRALLSDFLDAIENDRDSSIPGEEALATQRVIQSIVEKGV
ncbi:MAG: Gfo/Idh/MocA family oxidoreductase [Rhodospirillales bacterium]